MMSTDLLALAAIGGCAALSVGATARLLDGGHGMSRDVRCEVVVGGHAPGLTVAREGSVIMFSTGSSHEIALWADGETEKCRKRRRHRHPHRVEVGPAPDIERAMERAERARERAGQARLRAMEMRFDLEQAATEDAARGIEAELEKAELLEAELQESLDARFREMGMRLEFEQEARGPRGSNAYRVRDRRHR